MSFVLAACGIMSCKTSASREDNPAAASLPDTLRVGTLYSPTTYFIYRDEPMGYEYDMVRQYAESQGMALELTVAPNFQSLVELLDSGKVDLLACRVPMTSDYKDRILYCGPEAVTSQVLVQKISTEGPGVKDVTELIGKEVYVEEGTKYLQRVENLNEELGGGIDIHAMEEDSLVARDLVEMVAQGDVPFTVVDRDIAMLEHTYYSDIDYSVSVGMEQRSAWAVAKDDTLLARSIDKWSRSAGEKPETKEIHRRYFELSKNNASRQEVSSSSGSGSYRKMQDSKTISEYDAYFRKYAHEIGWDWRLLAAVAWEESRFDNSVTSWAGAGGVMQIMPRTAQQNGLPPGELRNPERNIATSVKIFRALDSLLKKKVPDKDERLKFVLAAYNSGQGHILDAIALAGKYGMDASSWHGNVREALLLKSDPKYYSDPVVRSGYFRGGETVSYVDRVLDTFIYYKKHIRD